MKYLKMLGLAAVAAAALMAFVGAGSASAETTACETTAGTGCYGKGTPVEGMSKAGQGVTDATLTSGSFFGQNVKCTSTLTGEINNPTTPSGNGSVTWSNCTGAETVSTVTNGTITIHHDAEHNGLVTIKDFVVHVKQSGVGCYYGGEITGTLTAGANPEIDITAEVSKITTHPSSAFCPSKAVWHANYEVIKPKPLYIVTGV